MDDSRELYLNYERKVTSAKRWRRMRMALFFALVVSVLAWVAKR